MYQLAYDLAGACEKTLTKSPSLQVLAVPFGLGAGDPRTALAPACLARAGLRERLRRSVRSVRWRTLSFTGRSQATSPEARFPQVLSAASATALSVERAVDAGNPFLVLGGDHSIAAGTWAGAARAMRKRGRIGLIWIDAHMDAHVPETTPSGNWHGMPLAHLLGFGRSELSQLGGPVPAVHPENLCLIGVRSFETDEADLLARLGVRVIAIEEVARRGVPAVLAEALAIAGRGTAAFGVSLDPDAIDPRDAPGVGTPVPDGIRGRALVNALRGIAARPEWLGMEVVEYNPSCDINAQTSDLIADLLDYTHWGSRPPPTAPSFRRLCGFPAADYER